MSAKNILHKEAGSYLREHLNLVWLRPESALWDAIASSLVSRYNVMSPSLDLGCGSGLFSFITAGGRFSCEYDVYVNLSAEGFWENKDIYDAAAVKDLDTYIVKSPRGKFDFGLDHKKNLLNQAGMLHCYRELKLHNANNRLPFADGELGTVFSNIIYWLDDLKKSIREIYRVLRKGGTAILCMPNTKFLDYCASYRWREKRSELLKMLNRGRSDNLKWVISYKDFAGLARKEGFTILDHKYYLSGTTLKFWDIGLRPLSPLLIKMSNMLDPQERAGIKKEWMNTVLRFIEPLYAQDLASKQEGGFHLFLLKK
ncbi:MAG: methyltransferase domain-containing protein [Candidatus Omnitrophica bacterium]|nr:methyltransferase domain-containing protein [Candidatus Omnitrophota bacterium]